MSTSRSTGQLLLPFKEVYRGPPYRRDPCGIDIVRVSTESDLEAIRTLFLEYARALDFDLNFQHFDAEMATLPGRYVPPGGLLLLATDSRDAAGCVAIRRHKPGIGEMKRLFVRPRYRGIGIGHRLAQAAMEEAAKLGYQKVRLDTVPGMEKAMALYETLGFYPIGAYCHNPVPGALFLECSIEMQKRI